MYGGGPALDGEFVGHLIAIRDLMRPCSSKPPPAASFTYGAPFSGAKLIPEFAPHRRAPVLA